MYTKVVHWKNTISFKIKLVIALLEYFVIIYNAVNQYNYFNYI